MSKKPIEPRHKRAMLTHHFGEHDDVSRKLTDVTASLILQFARMAMSDDPCLRADGRRNIKMVAEFCVAGQFYLDDQVPKAKKPRGTIETDQGRTSSAAIIRGLATKKDSLGELLKPADLWDEYIAKLSDLGLDPQEDKLEVIFDGGRTTKSSFRAALSRSRK